MPSRHRSRQRALQILFQLDIRDQQPQQGISAYYGSLHSEEDEETPPDDTFMEQLVKGTCEKMAEIDRRITGHSEHWRIERMPVVDRNILRVAVYEMTWGGTPPPVVIDEALELARRFSGDESVAFVNGVLDAVMHEGLGEAQPAPGPTASG